MTADASNEADPLAKAAERIRGSAQWLLGAFAAVGASLAAGLQIARIGDLSVDDQVRLAFALGGILAGVVGVIVAIAEAASVSTNSDISLPWLVKNPNDPVTKRINKLELIPPPSSLSAFADQLNAATTDALARFQAVLSAPTDEEKARLEPARAASYAELTRLQAIRDDLLSVASYYRVKTAFDRAKPWMMFGAFMAAAGITAFAWGANGPKSTHLDGGEVLPKTPSEVTLILTDAGVKEFGPAVMKTDKCDLSNLPAIAFAVDHDTYDVVVVGSKDCNVTRLSLSAPYGAVIPRVAEPSTASTANK